jgi:hypothetical protein
MGVLVLVFALVTPSAGTLSLSAHALSLVEPGAMVAAPNGGLYIYDTSRHQVLLRDPNGNMRVVAGNGIVGESGDGGLATRAELDDVGALALAPDGTLYLSGGGRVRAVSPSGVISTVAGNGGLYQRTLVSGTIALHTAIGSPGIAVSPTGRLYLTVGVGDVVVLQDGRLYLKLVPASFLGADPLFPEDREPGPSAIAFDSAGDLYIGGTDPYAVFALRPGGRLHTIGFLRLEPPDALAAGPPGSVVDAGSFSLVRFSAAAKWSGRSVGGHLLFDFYDLGALLHRRVGGFADGGVAVLPNGTAVVDGNAYDAPGDCHHAVLVEVNPKGQLKLIGNWQPHKSCPWP